MQVFVSSVITGFATPRSAAQRGAEMLGHHVVRAEALSANPATPQRACLAEARSADVVLLLLGSRYGARQESGLSATHEEYLAVRDDDKVLVFVEQVADREPEQEAFLAEVRTWERGHLTASFSTSDELIEATVKALRQFELARVAGPVDEADLIARARKALPGDERIESVLALSVATGLTQALIRPADLDPQKLGRVIAQEMLFGEDALFEVGGAGNPPDRGQAFGCPSPARANCDRWCWHGAC